MEKKKRNKLIFTACFILIAGILYTVTYIKPWKKEGILLDGAKASTATERTAKDCANSSLAEGVEDVTTNSGLDKADVISDGSLTGEIEDATGNESLTKESESATADRSLTKESEAVTANDSLTKENEDVNENGLDNLQKEVYIYVHLCGAVKEPGVYQVLEGSRLDTVVTCAGGLTEQAASEYINLAQTVVDGQQYFIPTIQDVEGMNRLDYTNSFPEVTGNTNTSIAGGKANTEKLSEQVTSDHVNINTATREELMTLPGVGEAKAVSIITYRETVSQYETIEDIMKVSGIKQGLFQKIRDQITVK